MSETKRFVDCTGDVFEIYKDDGDPYAVVEFRDGVDSMQFKSEDLPEIVNALYGENVIVIKKSDLPEVQVDHTSYSDRYVVQAGLTYTYGDYAKDEALAQAYNYLAIHLNQEVVDEELKDLALKLYQADYDESASVVPVVRHLRYQSLARAAREYYAD